jgi:hypothetical protein
MQGPNKWLESNAAPTLALSLDQIESVGMKSAGRKADPILALSTARTFRGRIHDRPSRLQPCIRGKVHT